MGSVRLGGSEGLCSRSAYGVVGDVLNDDVVIDYVLG